MIRFAVNLKIYRQENCLSPYESPNHSGGKGQIENVPKVLLLELLSLP